MRYSIMKILVSGCLSFIIATSAIDSYGMISNAYTESKLEESNIESNTDTDNEMIVKEKGIDSVPQEETVEETESTKETTTKIVDQVNEVSELITEQVEVKQTQQNSRTSIGTYKLTAYCPCSKCCGKWAGGNTSSGTVPTQGRTVACNTLAAGTRVNINGNDYIVEDTGNMKGNVIDIFFNSHQEALNFGVQYKEVFVYTN
jgi:3D (Asp-Asp-Asp) domain-containing protein